MIQLISSPFYLFSTLGGTTDHYLFMIPFFRKIRIKLAYDNKPLKYLRYAIGEIVLVVLGILIALQINNWNEQNTIQENIASQIDALILDLEKDKLRFKEVRGLHAFRVHSALYLLKQFEQNKDTLLFPEAGEIPPLDEMGAYSGPFPETYDKNFTVRGISWLIRYNYMEARSYTLEELKNSGLLAHFKNQELKTEILEYYDDVSFVFGLDNQDTNPTAMLKKTFMAKGYAYAEAAILDQPIETFLSEPSIRAIIINIIDESTYRANMSNTFIEQIEQLILELEMENIKVY